MKKFLLTLSVLAVSAAVNAETLYTFNPADASDFSCNQYTETHDATIGNDSWSIIGGSNNSKSWSDIRFGRKSAASCGYINTKFAALGTINQVVIKGYNAKTNATNNMFRAWVSASTSEEFTDSIVAEINVELFKGAANATWNITVDLPEAVEGMYYHVGFDMKSTGNNGTFAVQKVEYNGIPQASDLLDPELKFPESQYTAYIGSDFTAPIASSLSDGVVTYTSDNNAVATVDETTGDVTLIGAGIVSIKASIAKTDLYRASNTSYTLTVIDPSMPLVSAMGEEFTFEQENSYPWSHDATYGLKGSGYVSGAANECVGIAASPVIDLNNLKNINLNFQSAFNNYKIDNVMIPVDDFTGYAYVVVKEENETDWTELDGAITVPSTFSWNYYDNDPVSLDAYKGKKIQIGFKYVSTAECAGTWELKNIKISGDLDSSVAGVSISENIAPVYYNLQGVRVNNPEKGLYIVVKGNKSEKVVF